MRSRDQGTLDAPILSHSTNQARRGSRKRPDPPLSRTTGRGWARPRSAQSEPCPRELYPCPNLDVLARECERVGLGLSDPCVAPCMTSLAPSSGGAFLPGAVHLRNRRVCHQRGTFVYGERTKPNGARRMHWNRPSRAHMKRWRSIGCYWPN